MDHVKLGTAKISVEDGRCGSNRAVRVTAWFARARVGMLSVFLYLDAPGCVVAEFEGLCCVDAWNFGVTDPPAGCSTGLGLTNVPHALDNRRTVQQARCSASDLELGKDRYNR